MNGTGLFILAALLLLVGGALVLRAALRVGEGPRPPTARPPVPDSSPGPGVGDTLRFDSFDLAVLTLADDDDPGLQLHDVQVDIGTDLVHYRAGRVVGSPRLVAALLARCAAPRNGVTVRLRSGDRERTLRSPQVLAYGGERRHGDLAYLEHLTLAVPLQP